MTPSVPQSPVDAATAYLKPRSAVSHFTVQVEARAGNFVRMSARAPGLQTLVGYLKQRGDGWEVLGFGTYFEPTFFEKHRVPTGLKP